MVAAAETAPIERIPLQKDGGGRKRPKVRTSAQPPRRCIAARSPHRCTARTAAPPLRTRPKKQGGRKKLQPPIRYYLRPKRPLPRLRPCLPIGPAAVSIRPEALAEGASGFATIPLPVPEPALATAGLVSASA